jgi:two-component system alkaline phosphatase synthesis response regulator PhoP
MVATKTPKSKKTIVLADDEAFIALAYKEGLERAGFSVVVAHDGQEAVDRVREVMPDVVLLDLIMPKMNGFEVLKALKGDPKTKDLKILILSNLSQHSDENEARKAGAIDFMVKADHSLKEVVERVQSHLG